MAGIELLTDEEATECACEDTESRAYVASEEKAEGHIRHADEEEDEPAIDRRCGHDGLKSLLQLLQRGVVVIGVPGEATELSVEEEVEGEVAMADHTRHGVSPTDVRILDIVRGGRHEGHRDIPLEHHDRQLISVGMCHTCRIDYDTGGLHSDTGLCRSEAK